jgi:hypothetical protein
VHDRPHFPGASPHWHAQGRPEGWGHAFYAFFGIPPFSFGDIPQSPPEGGDIDWQSLHDTMQYEDPFWVIWYAVTGQRDWPQPRPFYPDPT